MEDSYEGKDPLKATISLTRPGAEEGSIERFHALLNQSIAPFVIQCAECPRRTGTTKLTDPSQLFLPLTCELLGEKCGEDDSVSEDAELTPPAFVAGSYVSVDVQTGIVAPAMIDYVPEKHPTVVHSNCLDTESEAVKGYYVSFLNGWNETFSGGWFPEDQISPLDPTNRGLIYIPWTLKKFWKCHRLHHIHNRLYRYSYMAHKYRLRKPKTEAEEQAPGPSSSGS